MVSSEVDDDMREAASEFRKATGSMKRATDVKGAVRRAERSIREQTASSPKPRGTPTSTEGEAGGPPADRLVEDASADRTTSVQPVPPVETVELADHSEPEDVAEPENPSHP